MGKSVKFKITASAIVCFIVGMLIILAVLFFYLQSAFSSTDEDLFTEMGEKYANMIGDSFENPVSFLSGVCSVAEAQIKAGHTDREALQQYIFRAFDKYPISEGTAFMMEPNVYDGLDDEYINSDYGTPLSGRISYYYYRENGRTMYLPQTEDDDQEFVQPYYLTSKERKVPTFSDPYVYSFGDRTVSMITASYPMMDDSRNVLGIMTVDLYLDSIHKNLSEVKVFDTGYIVVVSETGSILYCPDLSLVGEDAAKAGLLYEQPSAGETMRMSRENSFVNGKPSIVATVPLNMNLADSSFYISIVAPEGEANAVYNRLFMVLIGCVVLVGIAIIVVISIVTGKIVSPLNVMMKFLTQAGTTGNLNFSKNEWDAARATAAIQDEIGRSLAAFLKMLEQFVYYGQCLQTVAARDLTVKIHTLSEDDTCGVALRDMMTNLNSLFGEIYRAASQVSDVSQQNAHASKSLAYNASQQSASIEDFKSSIADIEKMAEDNTQIATATLNDVHESVRLMDNCTQAMDQMLNSMRDIGEKSQGISRIIKVIDDIAFQTNILALNAAVEAARAGQHGKGFAVVADEVRNLASKSAEAAQETASLIESSSHSVSEGSGIVDKVSENLRALSEISQKNAESIDMLHGASVGQSRSMAEIMASIERLYTVVQDNTTTAEETAASSQEMSSQSAILDDAVNRFKIDSAASR